MLSVNTNAERPFKTDDPYCVGLFRWETFGGLDIGTGSWEGIDDRTQVDFYAGGDYGLTDRSEIGVSWNLFRVNDPGSEGFGDGLVHYKHRIAEATPSWPDMALDVSLKLPTASRSEGLGTGKTGFGTALLLGWKPERWTNTVRLGYYQSAGANESARVEFGVATRYMIGAETELRGEIYIDGNEKFGQESRREVSAGIAFKMFQSTTLDLMLTAGVSTSVPDLGVKAGWRTNL